MKIPATCYRSLACFLCSMLLSPAQAPRQQKPSTKRFDLSIDDIMRGPGLYGYPPLSVRWSADSQRVYFRWKRHDEPVIKVYSTYVVNRDGSNLRKLSEEEEKEAPPLNSDDTRDWRLSVYASEGDLFLYDQMTGKRHHLTKTLDAESSPRFTHDEKRIAFVRANNLYVLSPQDGAVEQLTDIRAPGSPANDEDRKGTDSQEFLKKEQRDLLDYVREQAKKRDEDLAKRKKANPRKPFRLAARQSISALQLSPDESLVMASVVDSPERAKSTIVPNYVTDGAYTADISSRTKVGDAQSRARICFLDATTGEAKWLKHGIKETANDGKQQDREIHITRALWNRDGSRLVMMGRSADNKDEWIFAVDPKTAEARTLAAMHDDAWMESPAGAAFGWLTDNRRVYFTWERDGWSHLYTIDVDGGEPKQLTSGNWEVRAVELTADRSHFVLTTSEEHSGEDHLYLMGIDGGERRKLTTMPGGHAAMLSPDGATVASIYSYTNQPPELYLLNVKDNNSKPVKVTDGPAPEFWHQTWMDVPIVEIPARDGVKVPARIYKPANWKKDGPLVVFVHGAGYLQNVHHRWSSYAREYMFHHLLRERGYLVLDVDYRGSAGYGRHWRTAIYRHMGGKDLDDQVDAVQWAIKTHGVNPKRVGLYGGSYGGFITLMALFTQPDIFVAGAALRPVTDWAHYNHGYTSNILNIPQKDTEAYRKSSPIYHAQGLKGALLLCHGMVDTNVHFQDTVRLAQRLIELRKENWELAVYPVEDHAFLQPSSWADEYKRILKLFDATLKIGANLKK
ncbi:MAG TPA: alpha/beta fold hydrolase [Bryobacteraceae bacterium]|nr:alpha/beta fold hydrolase [Bryobacteraceae bacterium]